MKDFVEKVMVEFSRDITDAVFLFIEHDRDLMKRYLELAERDGRGTQGTLNQAIGKGVKERFGLDDDGGNGSPRSKLIETHQRFKSGTPQNIVHARRENEASIPIN